MEQGLNLFTTSVQVKQSSKVNSGTLQAPIPSADLPIKFGDLVLDASKVKLLWVQDANAGAKTVSTDNLEQQILELSVSLEGQLAIAAQENASPEAVEQILTRAVSQLWALLDEFDTQNGTQLVSELADSLQKTEPEEINNWPAQAVVPQVNKAANGGVPSVSFAGQMSNQVMAPTFSASTLIAQERTLASSAISQSGESKPATAPPLAQGGTPVLPILQPVNRGGGPLTPGSPTLIQNGDLGLSTAPPAKPGNIPALPILQPAIPNAGPPVPFSQSDIQAQNTRYFSQAPNLLNGSNSVAHSAPAQISGATSGSLMPAMNRETTPISQIMQDTKDLLSVQNSQDADPKLAKGAARFLPESVQQLVMAIPAKKLASSGDALGEGARKTGLLISSIVSGINIGAKFKELLVMSAQNVASGKEALASFGENGGGINSSKTEFSNPLMSTKPEQPAPPSGFSKNIANQIQKVTLNMGRTQIELAPRGLGSIIIELQSKESGGLQVVLRAESPAVLNAMRTDRDVLLAVLSNDDVHPEDISLDFESFGQNKFGQSEDEGELLNSITEQKEPEDEPILTPDRSTGLGHLNIIT